MAEASAALKAIKHGDPYAEVTPHEEVGFVMLAKIFHCFVIDHTDRK